MAFILSEESVLVLKEILLVHFISWSDFFKKQYVIFIRQAATLYCYSKSIVHCSIAYEIKRGGKHSVS